MRKEYDLADAKRGAALKQPGKTRITIMLDRDVVAAFRALAANTGGRLPDRHQPGSAGASRGRTNSRTRCAAWCARNCARRAERSSKASAAVDSCEPGPRPRPVKAALRAPPHRLPFVRPSICMWRRP